MRKFMDFARARLRTSRLLLCLEKSSLLQVTGLHELTACQRFTRVFTRIFTCNLSTFLVIFTLLHETLRRNNSPHEILLSDWALACSHFRISGRILRYFCITMARFLILSVPRLCARGCLHAIGGQP